jgi:hypothetical protein
MGDPPVTKTLGRLIAVVLASWLALGFPGSAFADMGGTGWDLLQDRRLRPTLFGVILLAVVIAAVGVIGLWRMAIRSAALEAARSEGDSQ